VPVYRAGDASADRALVACRGNSGQEADMGLAFGGEDGFGREGLFQAFEVFASRDGVGAESGEVAGDILDVEEGELAVLELADEGDEGDL